MIRDDPGSDKLPNIDRRRILKLTGVMAGTGGGVAGYLVFRDDPFNVTPAIHGLLKLSRVGYRITHTDRTTDTSLFDPADGITVVSPQNDQTGYWVGAPYPFIHEGRIYLYYRYRDPRRRGWKAVVAESSDGVDFEPIVEITRNQIDAVSLEGGALTRQGGEYVLYLSYNDRDGQKWKIQSIASEDITELDPSQGRTLDFDLPCNLYHVKDPVLVEGGMVVHTNSRRFMSNPTLLARRIGTGKYRASREIEIENGGFSRFRITSVVERDGRDLVFYDGERSIAFTWEEKGSVALSSDLDRFEVLLRDSVLQSPHGTRSLRYIRAVPHDDELWIYYEISMEGGGHEIKVNKLPMTAVDSFIEQSAGAGVK